MNEGLSELAKSMSNADIKTSQAFTKEITKPVNLVKATSPAESYGNGYGCWAPSKTADNN